jgi:hypothetical protein
MNTKHFLIALAALGVPAMASAQSLPEGVTGKGYIEYEYLTSDGEDASGIIGDFDISVAPGASGFGFDFGLFGLDFEDTSEVALYGALTYTTGNHKFSFGVPRSALKDHTRVPDIGGSRFFSLEAGILTDGLVDVAYLQSDETPIGLRYDGDFGAVKASASYHRFSDEEDVDVFGFGATYTQGMWFASGSVEHFDGESANGTLVHAEGGVETDLYSVGLGLSNGDDSYFDDTAVMLWGSYKVMPQLEVTATVLDVASTTLYGVSADYNFWSGAYAQLGYFDGDNVDDGVWDISLGWKF